jgi:hypothetical protein
MGNEHLISSWTLYCLGKRVTQPPPPPEVKKPNPWKILAVLLLMGIIGMGAVIGILWMGQTK